MTEPGNTSGSENKESSLDLSSLLGDGAFGPSWASGNQSTKSYADHKGPDEGRGGRKRHGDGKPRDRRQGQRTSGDRRSERPAGRGQGERRPARQRNQHRPYRPDFDIQLQPHPTAFAALIKAMRDSCRTFELFEVSRLFLSKSDRFVAKVLPKGSGQSNPHQDKKPEASSENKSEEQEFFMSIPDGIGFEHEGEAIDHVLGNHLDKFFEIEKVEKEPPNGTFNVVNRCTVTDTLLAPPNYHRYQHILQEHYASKIHAMAFERFESKIETVREKEAVDQWLESMKTGYTYKAKDTGEEFQHMEDARRHLLMNHKAKVVRTANQIRIEGKDLEKLPKNRIRRSIEAVLEKQLKVPLDFSNHLRGRLRRANFTIYKRGGKGGITYACAVKRQNRTPDTTFSDSIQELVEFIENNPEITAQRILKSIKPDAEQKEEPATKETPEVTGDAGSAAIEPSEAETTNEEKAEGTTSPEQLPETELIQTEHISEEPGPTAEKEAETDQGDTENKIETKEESPSPEPSKATAQQPEPKEEKPLVGEIPVSETLAQDLRWLVQYGYVTEYSDGRLFAPPIRIESLNIPATKASEEESNEEKAPLDNEGSPEMPEPKEEASDISQEQTLEAPLEIPLEVEGNQIDSPDTEEKFQENTEVPQSDTEPCEPTPETPLTDSDGQKDEQLPSQVVTETSEDSTEPEPDAGSSAEDLKES